jgi:hypothetical protein
MKLAFYKGTKKGIPGLYNRFVRWWDNGLYSHVELVFGDGMSASSSFIDKGVRIKHIEYNEANWDFLELPSSLDEVAARRWFVENTGKPYDLLGNLGFLWRPLKGLSGAFFCSEADSMSLQFTEAWRFSPNLLYIVFSNRSIFK